MRTIPAEEIERCGFSAVDEALKERPVLHVTKDGAPRYVIVDEAFYQEMVEDLREAEIDRVQASLEDFKAGRFRYVTVEELVKEFDLED